MTGTEISSDGLSVRRRRILFRAWHRGTREMDILFGRFIDAVLAGLDDAQLDQVEALIEVSDRALFAWITGEESVPDTYDMAVFRALRAFHNEGPEAARSLLAG